MRLTCIYYSPECNHILLYTYNELGIVTNATNLRGLKVDHNRENLINALVTLKYELIGFYND